MHYWHQAAVGGRWRPAGRSSRRLAWSLRLFLYLRPFLAWRFVPAAHSAAGQRCAAVAAVKTDGQPLASHRQRCRCCGCAVRALRPPHHCCAVRMLFTRQCHWQVRTQQDYRLQCVSGLRTRDRSSERATAGAPMHHVAGGRSVSISCIHACMHVVP